MTRRPFRLTPTPAEREIERRRAQDIIDRVSVTILALRLAAMKSGRKLGAVGINPAHWRMVKAYHPASDSRPSRLALYGIDILPDDAITDATVESYAAALTR